MSSGTGRATSQNSGIDWKDNLENPAPAETGKAGRDPSFCSGRQLIVTKQSLFSRFFRRHDAQVLHHHLQILPRLALLSWIAEQKRGMVGDGKARARP